jgi:hypothetical protein
MTGTIPQYATQIELYYLAILGEFTGNFHPMFGSVDIYIQAWQTSQITAKYILIVSEWDDELLELLQNAIYLTCQPSQEHCLTTKISVGVLDECRCKV